MGKYDHIIDHPHYQSTKRPHMSMTGRAAQFSPFAALVGYGEAVEETGRLTEERGILDESVRDEIARNLTEIERRLEEDPGCEPYVNFIYFVEDGLKEGGAYLHVSGKVKKMDLYERYVLITDGTKIPMDDIFFAGDINE